MMSTGERGWRLDEPHLVPREAVRRPVLSSSSYLLFSYYAEVLYGALYGGPYNITYFPPRGGGVALDETSFVSFNARRERNIYRDNTFMDGGCMQARLENDGPWPQPIACFTAPDLTLSYDHDCVSTLRSPSYGARVVSDCQFRKTATEYDWKSGIKWLSCTAN
jgi:hypothetical protein